MFKKSILILITLILLFSLPASLYAKVEKRVALVIGNADYEHHPLPNPVNDAIDMANTLETLGFEVILATNLTYENMDKVCRKFITKTDSAGGVGLFYFSGHGCQFEGTNYLIPIDNEEMIEPIDAKYKTINLSWFLEKMENAINPINICVLDACSDNPFKGYKSSDNKGFNAVEVSRGTFISYATAVGQVALSSEERNSIYTSYLLEILRISNKNIEEVFKKVGKEVSNKTHNKQVPYTNSSFYDEFIFNPDQDEDRICDYKDHCPESPEDYDNFEDDDGCPDVDNDNDKILDTRDRCPNDPEDYDNFEDNDGCPDVDNDNDGIVDTIDVCPDNPETMNEYKDDDGCPDKSYISYTECQKLVKNGEFEIALECLNETITLAKNEKDNEVVEDSRVLREQIIDSMKVHFASETIADTINKIQVSKKRVALVIGNANYKHAPLPNNVNDATDMAKVLEKLGFEVILLTDVATKREMEETCREFTKKLDSADVGLFYFSGHGFQIAENSYLIPTKENIQTPIDIKYNAIDLGWVLAEMEEAKNSMNICILDACRDELFSGHKSLSNKGFAPVEPYSNTFIAYPTAPGKNAKSSKGRNSVYTKHLLETLQIPNLSIFEVFMKVGKAVSEETQNKQRPHINSSFYEDFIFYPKP